MEEHAGKLVYNGEASEKSEDEYDDDDISIPGTIAGEEIEWFADFVRWQRKNYRALKSKLDPGEIHKMKPRSDSEAGYLNFLMYYDKYYSKRLTYEDAEKAKVNYPHLKGAGTDDYFHHLAWIFTKHKPVYFVNNSDVKGRTPEELERLKERPSRPYYCPSDYETSSSSDMD